MVERRISHGKSVRKDVRTLIIDHAVLVVLGHLNGEPLLGKELVISSHGVIGMDPYLAKKIQMQTIIITIFLRVLTV